MIKSSNIKNKMSIFANIPKRSFMVLRGAKMIILPVTSLAIERFPDFFG